MVSTVAATWVEMLGRTIDIVSAIIACARCPGFKVSAVSSPRECTAWRLTRSMKGRRSYGNLVFCPVSFEGRDPVIVAVCNSRGGRHD